MAQRPELRTQMGQHMLLAPRMLQAIQVLQLPGLELDAFLREAAEENEALVVGEPEREEPAAPGRARVSADATERHDEWLQSQPERARSAAERLEEQIALAELAPEVETWTRWLAGQLDERGFLPQPDDELVARAQAEGLAGGAPELARAREALARLEPRGLGARDAIHALLLQLDPGDPQFALLVRVLEEFLGELAKNRLPAVARALGISVDGLRELLARLAELDPRPGAALNEDSAPGIVPDVSVERALDGSWEVRVERSAWPAVGIDESVASLARDRAQPGEVRSYLRGKLDRARWVVDAVEQRGRTLLALSRAIFARQRAFLEEGPGHLAPLSMTELAGELGLHVSTVSRAVAGKYVQVPSGVFPLRMFFQQAIQSAAGQGELVRDDVREAVRSAFAGEDPAAPLSDDEVVARLRERGLELARRTVAKYRSELGIASSYLRRRHA